VNDDERRQRIRDLNDQLRQGIGGRIMLTSGVHARGAAFVAEALRAVAAFDAFTPDNDPYGEHDFGAFTVQDARLFFKLDAYDRELTFASPDPADPEVTVRVLTIMLAEEY
jgi:hypothetical protein